MRERLATIHLIREIENDGDENECVSNGIGYED